MNSDRIAPVSRSGALLAINLLFLMVWGFTGVGKIFTGIPPWFGEKFGATFMAKFPGLTAAFWMLALAEIAAFVLALVGLFTGEFLSRRPSKWLRLMIVWSLFVFVMLGFGQWLTSEFNGTAQLFAYFAGTLVALIYVENGPRAL